MESITTSQEVQQCEQCGASILIERCYWRRFCSDKCRNLYNAEAGRLGRKILKERREQRLKQAKGEG